MKALIYLNIFFLTLVLPISLSAQDQYLVSNAPAWAEVYDINFDKKIDESKAEGGIYYYLIEFRHNLPLETTFGYIAYKVVNSNGVQDYSSINLGYDPSYQSLTLHEVYIMRDGEKIDALQKKNIRSLQREQDLERNLYDGGISIIVNLSDVRAGDIIVYQYSRKGFNPNKKGNFNTKIDLEYSTPALFLAEEIITHPNQKLNIRNNITEIQPTIQNKSSGKSYEWRRKDVEAKQYISGLPAYVDIYESVDVSTFLDWKAIIDWSLENYKISKSDISQLKPQLKTISPSVNLEDRINEVLIFVKDEIRYLGFESGSNAYKPNRPEKVLNQRYGDCKDKSLLAVTLLSGLGVDAYPILVHSNQIATPDQVIPSSFAFNHCIMGFEYDSEPYIFDLTISNQRGSFKEMSCPNYGFGLKVRKNESALSELKKSEKYKVHITETFDIREEEADYRIISVYQNASADEMRDYFKSNSINYIHNQYLEFYQEYYENLDEIETLTYKDDVDSNQFTTIEYYRIADAWQINESGLSQFQAFPNGLYNSIKIENFKEKNYPYFYGSPLSFTQLTKYNLYSSWPIQPSSDSIGNEYFNYTNKIQKIDGGKRIIVTDHFERKKGIIAPEDVAETSILTDKIGDQLGYTFTKAASGLKGSFNWGMIFFVIIMCVLSYFICYKIYRYDPVHTGYIGLKSGLNGWLVLVGIGLFSVYLRYMIEIETYSLYFKQQIWQNLKIYENPEAIKFIVILEVVFMVFSLCYTTLLLILYFKKRTSFPNLYILFLVGSLLFLIIDTSMMSYLTDDFSDQAETLKDIVTGVVGIFIWVPYMVKSRRVRNTFDVRLNPELTEVSNEEE